MPPLISCQSITKSFGAKPLFNDISLSIETGERLGLIGPNGAGKSTLIKILCGVEKPDSGDVVRRRDCRESYVPQVDVFEEGETVEHALLAAIADEVLEDYERQSRIAIALSQIGFTDGEQRVDTLSGGGRKRLALARALIRQPDLVLLDEPTNHLDLQGVLWLEKLLRTASFGFVLISHDRYFLENVATRVVELNRAYPEGYLSAPGGYSDFLEHRQEYLDSQAKRQHTLEGQVKREVDWLRRGPQARTTKAQARIDSAHRLIDELSDVKFRNSQDKAISVDFTASNRKTKELVVAKGIAKSMGGRQLFSDTDFVLMPGTRLGLLGPNGSGKTTMLRLLNTELATDSGTVKRADGLKTVYFDQTRAPLDPSMSLRRALCPNGDTVLFQGGSMHVAGWARRFLFRSEQLEMPVGSLSGGEQARVLIANLMLQPADLLILDEPTNDLDIPSMEVLENNLLEFPGAVVLVTHDRFLLDTVSTELLALDGQGGTAFYADYAQWEGAQQPSAPAPARAQAQAAPAAPTSPSAARRLSTAEMRELEQMENTIMAAEGELSDIEASLSDPKIAADHVLLNDTVKAMEAARERVAKLYVRWEDLEARRNRR